MENESNFKKIKRKESKSSQKKEKSEALQSALLSNIKRRRELIKKTPDKKKTS